MKDRQNSARSSGRRSRGNDSYREDLESVRSLNDWEPTPRRGEEGSSARQAPAPAPALDLSKLDAGRKVTGIRGGGVVQAPEVQHQVQVRQQQQPLRPPASPLKLQRTAVEREKQRQTQQQNLQESRERQLKINEYASRARASDAIVPNVKTELNERERWDAEIQTQVMEPLYHRELASLLCEVQQLSHVWDGHEREILGSSLSTALRAVTSTQRTPRIVTYHQPTLPHRITGSADANDKKRQILHAFRKCEPDEFGFISKKNFVDRMRKSYRMTETESLRLFQLGGGADAIKSGELNYGQFCNALLSGGQNLRAAELGRGGGGGGGGGQQNVSLTCLSRLSLES